MTDHDRYQDDWDQDALFYGVPSHADRPPRQSVEPAPVRPAGPAAPPVQPAVTASSDEQPTRAVGTSEDHFDPTTMPMTGRAEPTVPFDPTTMAMTGPAAAQPPEHHGNVETSAFAPEDGLRRPPPVESKAGRYGPPVGPGDAPDRLEPVPEPKGYGRLPLIVAALAVLLIAGAVGGVALTRSSGRDDAGGPVTESAPQATPTETLPTETEGTPTETATTGFASGVSPGGYASTGATATADPQEEALAQLEAIRQEDLGTVSFDGQFVAQIASKYPGVNDPYQSAADGTHTFQVSDILAEHQRLRAEHGDAEHPVILLRSTDYGKRQLVGGQPLWVTFVVGGFPDKESVLTWCSSHFGNLSATELKNHCDSRNLRPAA
ncbi:hypothetical protein [Actinoplanes sp. CA-252034]|uniref:hypothetical protein n=1 Tax=Actinoplanes sp. CA-252034 TaxID=3239906 RepID=UPI003D962C76